MTAFLLSIHVLAAILTVGPVTIAGSMFPRFARAALAAPGDRSAGSIVRVLHRICRVYSTIGIFVPVFGAATAISLGVLTDTWLLVAISLTAVAAAILVMALLPQQRHILARVESATGETPAPPMATIRSVTSHLGMMTGFFSLLWAIVTVLMIVRPGSTTGV